MKKVQRRERNKLAAARCRKRRLDLTNQLQVGFLISNGKERRILNIYNDTIQNILKPSKCLYKAYPKFYWLARF